MTPNLPIVQINWNDSLFAECRAFVEEQSAGEWGEDIELADATKLFEFVTRHRSQAIERCAQIAESYDSDGFDTGDEAKYWIATAIRQETSVD